MWSLKDKIAVVTGAGNKKSIGYAVACALRQVGVKTVFLFDLNQLMLSHSNFICKTHNVANLGSVLNQNSYIEKNYGPVDILVNCAGILDAGKDVHDYTPEDAATMKHVIDVNLYGAINWYCAVIPGMIARNDGCIINMASIAGLDGRPSHSAYAMSKAALISFTRSVSWEAASKAPNVRVNAVAPGFVDTNMTASIPEDAREAILRDEVPSHQAITPQEVADAVMSLIRNTGRNGAIDVVDKRRR